MKTDCLLTQRLPKRFAERLRALEALRHPDGTPVYRVEETKPLLGSRAPRMEAERPKQRRWNGVDDPISHCLAGNSLLLTGLPGTGKTHLARTIVARLREQGEAAHLVSKTHCSAQNLGLGAQTADHWVRRNVRGGSAQKLDWLVVEEITQLDMALWADLACVGLNADVKFLLLGDFRQLPAVLDSWAGRPISAPLEHSPGGDPAPSLRASCSRAVKVSARDPAGNRVPRPAEFARRRGRALVEARHVWLMARQWGVLFEVRHLMLEPLEAPCCPF